MINMKNKKKIEKSFVCLVSILLFGMICVSMYYVAIFFDKPCDSTVANTALTTIIGGLLSYFLYQFGLKNSRNKYGIDSEGQPFETRLEYDDNGVDEESDDEDNDVDEELDNSDLTEG